MMIASPVRAKLSGNECWILKFKNTDCRNWSNMKNLLWTFQRNPNRLKNLYALYGFSFLHRATPSFFEVDCVERDTPRRYT